MSEKNRDLVCSVPFYAHEADMSRMERTNRRLTVLCAVLSLLLPVVLSLGRMAKK